MPETYEITDPNSGLSVELTGDSPPTEAELEQIFSELSGSTAPQAPSEPALQEPVQEEGDKYLSPWQAIKHVMSPEVALADIKSIGTLERPEPVPFLSDEEISQFENVPEFRGGVGGFAAAAMVPDVNERAQIFENLGMKIGEMDGQPTVIDPEGREYLINKPGWSLQDAVSLAGEIGKFMPAGAYAASGKGLLRKFGRGLIGSFLTSTASETAQKAAGGTFDPEVIGIETLLGGAAEFASPAVKGVLAKLSPKYRNALKQANTMEELMKASDISIDDLKKAIEEATEAEIQTGRPATLVDTSLDAPPSMAKAAAMQSPDYAARYDEFLADRTKVARDSMEASLSRLTGKPLDKTFRGTKQGVEQFFDRRIEKKNVAKDLFYERALANNPSVDTTTGVQVAKDILKTSKSPKVRSAVKDALDAAKRATTARELQESVLDIRDTLKRAGGEGGIGAFAASAVKRVNDALIDELDRVTDKGFSEADAIYGKLQDSIQTLMDSQLGEARKATQLTYQQFLDGVFNPKAGNKQLSRRFMNQLAKENPQAAKDLYGAYFMSRMKDLPPEAKPSEIIAGMFGKGENAKNAVLELAPDAETAKNLDNMYKMLKVGQKLEGFSKEAAFDKWASGKMDPDAAHWVYVRLAISRALKKRKDIKLADVWYESATNPKFMEDWDKLLADKKVISNLNRVSLAKRQKEAEGLVENASVFFERVAENLKPRSAMDVVEAAAPGAAIGAKTEYQRRQEDRTLSPSL
jgi:hypothetical protein